MGLEAKFFTDKALEDSSMGLIIKIAVLSIFTLALSACGGGGSNADNDENLNTETTGTEGSAPDPEAPATVPDTVTSEPDDPQQDTTEPDTTTPDQDTSTQESDDPITEPVTSTPNNSSPDDSSDNPPPAPTGNIVNNKAEASLFLNRATFGPTEKDIDYLVSRNTYQDWVNEQFETTPTYHLPKVKSLATKTCSDKNDAGELLVDSWEIQYPRHQIWWETALNADDQLRQRVALALSEILVISDSPGLGLNEFQLGMTSYYDVLVKHAFGNYRDLLEEITLHPNMGDFLSMSRNQKSNEEGTIRPDENYARELLQLFTIGVHQLNIDGSAKLGSDGEAIPTYNQKTIEEFAKVFTGWSYQDITWWDYFADGDHTKPLVAFEEYHDTSAKTLFNGAISDANQTALEDLRFALDNIYAHSNIGPYISKQLIKRLVTSNPSPEYISRVAEKFNDNGSGVKGDMKAVVSAILLDQEALASNKPDNFGKLREPMLRMSHLWRAFNMQTTLKIGHHWESEKRCGQGAYPFFVFYDSLETFAQKTGQGPLQARSVFNFFKPDYSPSGVLNDNGLTAPEFQIINENTMVAGGNLFNQLIEQFSEAKPSTPAIGEYSKFNLQKVTQLASDTEKLLDYMSLVLLNNQMTSALRTILSEHLNQTDVYAEGEEGRLQKAQEAILLIVNSPEYLIQR